MRVQLFVFAFCGFGGLRSSMISGLRKDRLSLDCGLGAVKLLIDA